MAVSFTSHLLRQERKLNGVLICEISIETSEEFHEASNNTCDRCVVFVSTDHQKLEREARICRLLKHPNIGN